MTKRPRYPGGVVPCAQRKRGVCGVENCAECRPRSFAAYPNRVRVAAWSAQNKKQPFQVPMNSGDPFKFDCSECHHTFEIQPDNVVKGKWCGYCANKKLCNNADCTTCFDKSLASFNPEKMSQWSPNNKLPPRQIFKGASNQVVLFDCNKCKHEFQILPNDLTRNKKPRWCNYCSSKKLCTAEDCEACFQRSFASCDPDKVACWDLVRNKGVTPRELFKSSSKKIWFICNRCPHSFFKSLDSITNNSQWCPFCCNNSNRAICGEEDCTFCKMPCAVCLLQEMMVVGQRQTPGGLLCTPCYIRSPHCTPAQRAKISMEMQVIHGLHDLINKTPGSYMFRELTSWDCPVLPGLSFKPDLLWAFDAVGNCFTTAGSCSLSLEQVTHLMSVEVLEHGRQQHSDDRKIPDAVRELKMREDLPVVPFCVIYVTVANNSYHTTAHSEDVFFTKINDDTEYSIIPERKAAWKARIKLLLKTMMQARAAVSNETIWIGH